MDNFQLGFLSTEHLIRQGFERISIFLAPLNLNHMKDRLAGYRAAMKEYRKQVCPGFIEIIPCREPYAATCAAVDRLLTLQPPVEGAVFMSNTIALPALEHLQAKRIAIPDVLGIVSMEAAPYFSLMHPSVSAVDLNIGRLAERSFEMLMKLIHGDEPLTAPAVETIPVSLIPRESSLRREKERNFSGKP
jgi:LacI family transcriptional regulator